MNTIQEMVNDIEKEYKSISIQYITKVGSHLFGTSTDESDTDYYGIFISDLKGLLLQKKYKYNRKENCKRG